MKKTGKEKHPQMGQTIFTVLVVVASITTDGFGAAPPSQFSEDFREQLSETLPSSATEQINEYLNNINAATIPAQVADAAEEEVATSAGLLSENFLEFLNVILPPTIFDFIYNMTTFVDANTVPPQAESTSSPEEIAQTLVAAISNVGTVAATPLANTYEMLTALPSPNPSAIPSLPPTLIPPSTSTPSWTFVIPPTSNRPPSCTNINYTSPQAPGAQTIDISSQCSDPDGDTWTLTSVTQGANGTTTFTSPNIYYDPNDGFAGTDNITFIIQDSKGASYSKSFSPIITNLSPTTAIDTAIIAKNSAVAVAVSVLNNDSDPGGDTLTITGASSTSGATVSVVGTNIEYLPPTGFSGNDSFSYTIQDTHGGANTGAVNISVNNSPPTCPSLLTNAMQTTGSLPVDISSWCSDPNGDTYTITVASSASGHGVVTHNGTTHLYYDPNDGFAGTDQVNYTLDDGDTGGSASYSCTIQIDNLPPTATADTMRVIKNSSNNVLDVLINDTDPGNDEFTITAVSAASNGTVSISASQDTLIYTPNSNYLGLDSFTYTINDGNGGTATGSVTVSVKVPWCSMSEAPGTANSEGCLVNRIKLNGTEQNTLTVSGPSAPFTLAFDYKVWDTLCPSCSTQIMPGIETTFAGSCAYDGTPGAYTGASGVSGVFTLNAPSTPGDWGVFLNLGKEPICTSSAYLGYGEVIALITVPTPPPLPTTITMYDGGMIDGNIGGRSGADALCAGNLPAGYTNSHAFISVDSSDAIAGMAAKYAIPTTVEIKSTFDISVANNWNDLIAGTFNADLSTARVLPSSTSLWWSGGRNGTGSTCNSWTDQTLTIHGGVARANASGGGWMDALETSCSGNVSVICVAYP